MNAAQAVINGEIRSLQQDLDRATQQVRSIEVRIPSHYIMNFSKRPKDEHYRTNGRRTKVLAKKNNLLAKLDQLDHAEQELQARKEELEEMLQVPPLLLHHPLKTSIPLTITDACQPGARSLSRGSRPRYGDDGDVGQKACEGQK